MVQDVLDIDMNYISCSIEGQSEDAPENSFYIFTLPIFELANVISAILGVLCRYLVAVGSKMRVFSRVVIECAHIANEVLSSLVMASDQGEPMVMLASQQHLKGDISLADSLKANVIEAQLGFSDWESPA
jgi:hypothetical protein